MESQHLPPYAVKHEAPFRLHAIKQRQHLDYTVSIHEPISYSKRDRESESPERAMLRQRPSSSVPESRRKMKSTFRNAKELSSHVEHMYSNEYGSNCKAKCDSCAHSEVKHHWPDKKKIKFCKRIRTKTLKRLYGSRAVLIEQQEEKRRLTRPVSA